MLTNNVHGKMLGVLAIKKMAQTANPQRDASTRLETGSGTTSNPVHRWWPYKVAQPRWQTGWWFLVKLNGCPPESPAIPPLGTYSKEMKTSSTSRPAAALLLRAPNWAQPTCPSPGGYSSKVGSIHPVEHCSAGRKQLGAHATTWANLERSMPAKEVRQGRLRYRPPCAA